MAKGTAVAVAVVIAALAGGLVAALVVRTHDGGNGAAATTVVVRSRIPGAAVASAAVAAKGFDPARLYATRASGVVTIYSYFGQEAGAAHAAQGSGFVASGKGYVLTNAHVITTAPSADVRPAQRVYVEFADGDRAAAHVVGYDLFSDVGLLRLDAGGRTLEPVPLGDSSRVVVGQPVAAIGSPFGRQNSLTVGVVSGTRRSISSLTSDYDLPDAIQTDAPINHGNSGGPLFDAAGRVIGINAQIRSDSGGNEGVGFAVPINAARRAMEDLLRGGAVRYAYVGVSTQDLTPSAGRELGYRARFGALVACVQPGGPADRAGFHAGEDERFVLGRGTVAGSDVIVAVGGRAVRSGGDLVRIVTEQLRPGQRVVFTVERGSATKRVAVRLAERPSRPSTACG